MKVILLDEIKGKGGEGDVVEVAQGYAENFLFPKKLAVAATKGNLKQLDERRNNIAKREAVRLATANETKAAFEGKLRYSSWERDGQRRSKLEVIVDEIEFMSSRGGQGGYDQGGYAPAAPAPAARPAAPVATPPAVDVYDEDIPF